MANHWTNIWRQTPTLATLQSLVAGNMCEHLAIEFTEIGANFLKAKMPVDRRTVQPAGLLHGGASVSLAETLGSIASVFCIDSTASMPVGIEINANHLKSATSGSVTGTVKPLKIGRSLHVWSIEIVNDQSEVVCISRLTVMIVPKKEAPEMPEKW